MQALTGYVHLERIDKCPLYTSYRAQHEESGKSVIIRRYRVSTLTSSEFAAAKQECETLILTKPRGLVELREIIEENEHLFTVHEDFEGPQLSDLLKDGPLPLQQALEIGTGIAEILGTLHNNKIIHNNLRPRSILYNPTTRSIRFSDFGILSPYSLLKQSLYASEMGGEVLPYISPEQSGRMNREVDYRTDFYSMGVTLYEMVTGTVPFSSKDPLEVVHAHIAKAPTAPSKQNPSLPQVVSDIILKLLSKPPEDRYQNAIGIFSDLQECSDQFGLNGNIAPFKLAQKDISNKFNISHLFLGREAEIESLISTVDRTSLGTSELAFVSGPPGIGKSALIRELQKKLSVKETIFLIGRCDQLQMESPYGPIIKAFQGLMKQIVSGDEKTLENWKSKLQDALGPNGKIIADIIPSIELIIGKQPEISELGPEEAHNRTNFTFRNFINVFAKKEHPLVLVFDDLQWADSASLNLLKLLGTDNDIGFLSLICTYRPQDGNPNHPLTGLPSDNSLDTVGTRNISLGPLDRETVNHIVSGLLSNNLEETAQLSDIIHKKTNGNPFFINEFLHTLFEGSLLYLDPKFGWGWDIEAIEKIQVTDNVSELLANNIIRLPEDIQNLLMACACIGEHFDLDTVSNILDQPSEETLRGLSYAVREEMIYLSEGMYRFRHSNVRAVAYAQLSGDDKAILHYRIGKHLQEHTLNEHLRDNAQDITYHLNQAISLLFSEDEKYQLADLNRMAGEKALASAAYESAQSQLTTGIGLLGSKGWQKRYQLALSLYTSASISAYLNSDHETMEQLSDETLKNVRSLLDKAKIYDIKIKILTAQNKPSEAIHTGVEALKLLGMRFSDKPLKSHILYQFLKVKLSLVGKSTEKLLYHKEMQDPYLLSMMRIITSLAVSAYLSNPGLFVLLSCKMVHLSLRHGNCYYSPISYGAYGIVLCTTGQIETGYEFSKLALKLQKRLNSTELEARTIFQSHIWLVHWKQHIRDTLNPLLFTYRKALETGDLEISALSLMVYGYHSLHSGVPLNTIEQELVAHIPSVSTLRQKVNLHLLNLYHQTILNLMGRSTEPTHLSGARFDESNTEIKLHAIAFCKLMLCYLFEDYPQALANGITAKKHIRSMTATAWLPVFHFYDSLTRLAMYQVASRAEKAKTTKIVSRNQKTLKKWMRHGPMNIEHRYIPRESRAWATAAPEYEIGALFIRRGH